ncbi:hypothetical protein PENTCL1PPCAC_4566 [Pristionchus entomophagus]|uniref:Smr domain-containing protein n=1 Tax=Pristionchus entomophagus TaxID=358040 RepID=A0AAV5SGA3_9BILA|nr:hypothetical protein PENTCL1PPCAC_4566 [Pristionchus entomophagus]
MSTSTNKPRSNQPSKLKLPNNELKNKPQPNNIWDGNSTKTANKFDVLQEKTQTTMTMSLEEMKEKEEERAKAIKAERENKKNFTSSNSSKTQNGLWTDEGEDGQAASRQKPEGLNSKQRQDLKKIQLNYPHVDRVEIKNIFMQSGCNFKKALEKLEKEHGKPAQVNKAQWDHQEKKNGPVERKKITKARKHKYSGHDQDIATMIVNNGGQYEMLDEFTMDCIALHAIKKTVDNVDAEFKRLYDKFAQYLDENVVYMRHLPTRMGMNNFENYEELAKKGKRPTTVRVYHGSGNDSKKKKKQTERSDNKKTLDGYLRRQGYTKESIIVKNSGCLEVIITPFCHSASSNSYSAHSR